MRSTSKRRATQPAAASKLPPWPSATRGGAGARASAGRTRRARRAPAPESSGAAPILRAYKAPMSVGERPQAPWHPLPLSELLILVGAVATIIGFSRARSGGFSSGGPTLIAGLVAVGIGTIEVDAARAPQRLPLAHADPGAAAHDRLPHRRDPGDRGDHDGAALGERPAAVDRCGDRDVPLQSAAPALPRRPSGANVQRARLSRLIPPAGCRRRG